LGWALAAQVLHDPCFAALWTGGVDEAQQLAPKGLEVTAQSLSAPCSSRSDEIRARVMSPNSAGLRHA
jgi:hypothetical protein